MSDCELCEPKEVLFESDFTYVRYDSNPLSRLHVHLMPRYAGDVPDPRGGIRCVLAADN